MPSHDHHSSTFRQTPLRSALVFEGIATFGITLAGALVAVLFPYDLFAQAQLAQRFAKPIDLNFGLVPCVFLSVVTFLMILTSGVKSDGLGNPLFVLAHWRLGRASSLRSIAMIGTQLLSAFAAVLVTRAIFPEELVLLEQGLPDFSPHATQGQAALIQGIVAFLLIWIRLSFDAIESTRENDAPSWKRALIMGTMTFAFTYGFRHHLVALGNPALPLAFWGATGIQPSLVVFLMAPLLGAWSAIGLHQFANEEVPTTVRHPRTRSNTSAWNMRASSWR